MKIFRWREIGTGHPYRAGSGLLCGPRAFPVHYHDFPEVFWIAHGTGTHWINGEEHPLQAGTLVMMRPRDTHGFRSDKKGVLVNNMALQPEILAHVKRRYFRLDDGFWNGNKAPIPRHHTLPPDTLKRLNAAFEQLCLGPGDLFHVERFLLNLLHLIRSESHSAEALQMASYPGLPGWLADALARWGTHPGHFAEGTPALARLAGRSPEHVARVLHAATGRTPTDWLNGLRMKYAAKQLEVTNRKVLDIALECGFGSLGHFYAVFQKAHHCAPRAYRMRFQPRPI